MKREYIKPITEIVDLRVSTSIAQTTMHISSLEEQDNDVALAKTFQYVDEWTESYDLMQHLEWKDYLWDE